MNALSIRSIAGAGAAALAAVVALSAVAVPAPMGLVSAALVAGLGLVAFAAQSRRLRETERLVYQPVYVRRHPVQRRVMSDFE